MSKLFCDSSRKIYLASCLYDCIEDSNIRALKKLLIDNNADPNIIIPDRGISPLHLAIGNDVEATAEECVRLFLEFGGDPNVRSDEKLTPVHIAAAWGRLAILNLLLHCGGDPTLRDDQNKIAEDYAREEQHFEIVDYLEKFRNDQESKCENLRYNFRLDKIIINNGQLIGEYGLNDPGLTDPEHIKLQLPEHVGNSYVNNWCLQLANLTQINSDLIQHENIHHKHNILNKRLQFDISSSDDNNLNQHLVSPEKNLTNNLTSNLFKSGKTTKFGRNITRESGISTIPSDKSEYSLNLIHKSSRDSANLLIATELSLNACLINDTYSKSNSSSEYLTCESINSLEKNIVHSIANSDDSKIKNSLERNIETFDLSTDVISITSDESVIATDHITNIPCQDSDCFEQVFEVAEEYKYVDKEEDVVLIEKHILVHPKCDDTISLISSQPSSKVSSLPSVIDYDTDILRNELTSRGEPPGPITKTTKRVYLKKLKKLMKYNVGIAVVQSKSRRVYSVELEKTLRNPNWVNDLYDYKTLEQTVTDQFSSPEPSKRWREGVTKTSFTYLLLDPRITNNLPNRSDKLNIEEQWQTFLSAIFYVGKGKRSRPYCHLYEAIAYWQETRARTVQNNKKCQYILDIWRDKFGVVCLHIFQNIIPVEAYTREAAMIQAIKLQNLCNSKVGDFYGQSATWPERQKRQLGVYLLYRAMLIFLNEGERQLRPDDIGK